MKYYILTSPKGNLSTTLIQVRAWNDFRVLTIRGHDLLDNNTQQAVTLDSLDPIWMNTLKVKTEDRFTLPTELQTWPLVKAPKQRIKDIQARIRAGRGPKPLPLPEDYRSPTSKNNENYEMILSEVGIAYRVRALRDFEVKGIRVSAGEVGGRLETESSLDYESNCWIDKSSYVPRSAHISGNSVLLHSQIHEGNEGNVLVNMSKLKRTYLEGAAEIVESTITNSELRNVEVRNSTLTGVLNKGFTPTDLSSIIYSTLTSIAFTGDASFHNVRISNYDEHFQMTNPNLDGGDADYLVAGPLGRDDDLMLVYRSKGSDYRISTGCFHGTLKEFDEASKRAHSAPHKEHHRKAYMPILRAAIAYLKAKRKLV